MKTHDLIQGSDAWHQFRLDHDGASEAAAMLGLSPKVKRSELLRAKHTGLAREFSDWLQRNVLDKGHEVEALARPHVEKIIGDDLYPITCSQGRESASCDGLTLGGEIAFEHKQWNDEIAAVVRAGRVPDEHMPQCQQVLMVTGAERLIFVVSDGTPERMVYVWVTPDPAWFQRLRDGWAQFRRDLAAYVLPKSEEPPPIAKAPETLPALRIEVTGAVTASNLAEFKATALATVRSVNRTLQTDQDFADAEKAVKWCGDVEERIKAAKQHALSQTASIDELFRTLDDVAAEFKATRLDLDKLVTRRKVEVREHAVVAARQALDDHIAVVNAEIAPMRLQPVAADFAGAIKGRRSLASMQDALDTTLAAAKIAADTQGRAIRANVQAFKAATGDDRVLQSLFADLGALVHKAADDFATLVDARIATHRAAEAKREAERQAAEAARIAAAEQRAREQEAARLAALAATPAPTAAPAGAASQGNGLTEAQFAAQYPNVTRVAAALAARTDEPAAAPRVILAGPEPEQPELGALLAELQALAAEARASRFPSQPKMGAEWWARFYALADAQVEVAA